MPARASQAAGRHPALAATLVLGLLAVLTRPASFQKPIERDTGQLLYVGHLLAHGGTPYVDAALNKGPVAFLLFAGIDTVTATKVVLVRLVLVLFVVAAGLGVAAVVARTGGRTAGIVAGIAFVLLAAAQPIQGDDPNTEQFGIAFLAGAWGLASLAGTRAAISSGVTLALGVLLNPLFAVVAPVVAWELLAHDQRRRWRRLLLALGGAAVVFALIGLWLAATGALDDAWRQITGHGEVPLPRGPAGGVAAPVGASGFAGTLRDWLDVPGGALYWLGAGGAALALRRRELRLTAIAALSWIVLVWVRIELQSYSFPHHFYIALPAIAVGIALGVASCSSASPGPRLALLALVLAAPFVTYVAAPQVSQLELPAAKRWSLQTNDDWSLAYPVARFIDDHTRPNDRVLATGSDPEVLWLADRRAPSRYFDWFIPLRDAQASAERRRALETAPPAAVAVMDNDDARVDEASLRGFLESHRYVVALTVGRARVWLPRLRP